MISPEDHQFKASEESTLCSERHYMGVITLKTTILLRNREF